VSDFTRYFILQKNDESAAYAFKISQQVYKPRRHKNQREQYTATGKLDVQAGQNARTWFYGVKLGGGASGTVTLTPGTLMTADSASWGDHDDLGDLFDINTPPDNRFRFRDVDGSEYYVIFSGDFEPELTTKDLPAGDEAKYIVAITLRLAE
jgi:hypothetical protein